MGEDGIENGGVHRVGGEKLDEGTLAMLYSNYSLR